MSPRFQMVACPCRTLVRLDRANSRAILGRERGKVFVLYGGICERCGRGLDLYIEKQPGTEVRRG